jgi:hypothetical protein
VSDARHCTAAAFKCEFHAHFCYPSAAFAFKYAVPIHQCYLYRGILIVSVRIVSRVCAVFIQPLQQHPESCHSPSTKRCCMFKVIFPPAVVRSVYILTVAAADTSVDVCVHRWQTAPADTTARHFSAWHRFCSFYPVNNDYSSVVIL